MANSHLFVGVDVGGQSIKGGVVQDDGKALSSVSVPTEAERGQDHGLNQMAKAVTEAVAAARKSLADIAAIGVATPGTMDIPAGMILDPPNLRPWRSVPVRSFIEKRFGKPTAFQNDANAAAYGEYWAGVGRDAKSLVLFTLGTGIGCGIIINDFILEGEHSHGAEVGHIVIQMDGGRMCGCGQPGHLEAYASAIGIAARTVEALAEDDGTSTLHKVLHERGEFDETEAVEVFRAAAAGDDLARRIIEETSYHLAVGAVNMMHTINPNMVVFGGGMIRAGEWFLEKIRGHIKRLAFPVPAERTEVVYAQLGNDAGFIGAAGCARQLFLARK
jgi:glucokinase